MPASRRGPVRYAVVGAKYQVDHTYSYSEYEPRLETVDAVYIALPNSMHAEYTMRVPPALRGDQVSIPPFRASKQPSLRSGCAGPECRSRL
jgi:hypothetical protein